MTNSTIRKWSGLAGDGKAQVFRVCHGLATRDVVVSVYDRTHGYERIDNFVLTLVNPHEVTIDTSHQFYYEPDEQKLGVGPGWTPEENQLAVVVVG